MKDLEQRVKELETIVEYVFEGQKNINKQFDSFAEEMIKRDKTYDEALGEMADLKRKIFLHFFNEANNNVENNVDYKIQEGLVDMPNHGKPLNFDEYFDNMAVEMGVEPEEIVDRMWFPDPESYEKFQIAYVLLSEINTMLEPQELFDLLMSTE
jgi:hypothetical protein